MLVKIFFVFIVLTISIILGYISSHVNFTLMKDISSGKIPTSNQWVWWGFLQLFMILNLTPSLVSKIILKDISNWVSRRFINDIRRCKFEKVDERCSELQMIYSKLDGIAQVPIKFGWAIENIAGLTSGSIAIWYVSGYWVLWIIMAVIISVIIDEFVNHSSKRNNIIKKQRNINMTKAKHMELLPIWHCSGIYKMELSLENILYEDKLLHENISTFWRKKNVLPEVGSFCVSAFILTNIDSVSSDPATLLLALTNLGFFVNTARNFIRNINNLRMDISKFNDYLTDIAEMGRRPIPNIKVHQNFPPGITLLTGISGAGKTCLIRKIIEHVGDKVAYLPQSDNVNYNKMTVKEAIMFLQIKENIMIAQKVLNMVCLNKNLNDLLVRPSGGEVQKIRIARAIYAYLCDLKRDIIILDEPDNNINPGDTGIGFKQIIENIFQNIRNGDKILFTTHKAFVLDQNKSISRRSIEELEYILFM